MKRSILLALLCGCATVPMARTSLDARAKDSRPPPDAANVYVYRPGSVVGTAVTLYVYLDEVRIGALAPGTFAMLVVRPGEHKLTVRARSSAEKALVVEPGHEYFVKATPAFAWKDGPSASIELVTNEEDARRDVRGCGLIANLAADAIRAFAAELAKVDVDAVPPDELVAAATKTLDAMTPHPDSEGADLDAVVSRLRAAHPGIDDQRLIQVSALAMLTKLHTRSKPDDAADARAVDPSCGLVLRPQGHDVVIVGVLPDSPAAEAGLLAGLELREVDGRPTRDQPAAAIAQLLAGTPGTPVALLVAKPAEPERKVVLRRATLESDVVDCRIIDGRVLYLRPWTLRTASARRIRDHARSAGASAERVILDLRDNTGGPLDGARDVADSFLASGTMFTVAGARVPNVDKAYVASAETSQMESARLVVLVNGNTLGTAEAVAAAIQDHRRGSVLGTRTSGYATVDFWRRIGGLQVPIPTARLLRASGQPLSAVGVTPDSVDDPPAAAITDAACAGLASPASVSDDQLVRRAAALLMRSAP
jgi:carboxyl-terminal processing protease